MALDHKSPPMALTMGEPAGIGGEITLKAWHACRGGRFGPAVSFFIIGDPNHLAATADAIGIDTPVAVIEKPDDALSVFDNALPVLAEVLPTPPVPGQPDTANGGAVIASIRRAVELALAGDVAAIVTNPIHKKTLHDAGFAHPGHTEYLGELTDVKTPIMMLACPGLRVVPVTVHLSLKDAIRSLSSDAIITAGRVTAQALKRDFAIPTPRLAVASLNPHGGEDGMMGREDISIITPALTALKAEGIEVYGPAPPDSLFHARMRETYDAVICMYHDQALIPLKTIDFDHGVDITLGLPVVRTSPDHGTAFEIAGQGIAREDSLITAIEQAATIAENRCRA